MKRMLCVFLTILILLASCSAVLGEETITVITGTGTGTRGALAPSGPLSPVVPYANVFWGDTQEAVLEAAGGEAGEQDGAPVVTASVEIEGIPRDVRVIYFFDESGLCRVEAIASSHMTGKLEDMSSSSVAKALNEHTKSFFTKWLNRYFWHGDGLEIFMTEHTVAGMRCRGSDHDYRLSVVYYPPAPFNITKMEDLDGIGVQETDDGKDIQYYPSKPMNINVNTSTGTYPLRFFEIIRVREYTQKYIRIPYSSLAIMFDNSVDIGEMEYVSLTIDGTEYRFVKPVMSTEKTTMVYMVQGEDALAMWDGLAATEQEIRVVIKGKNLTIRFPLPEEVRQRLLAFHDVYCEAGGMSGIAMEYASGQNDGLQVTERGSVNVTPAYTIDASAVPFMELDWKEKINNLSKQLDVKAEKSGQDQILRTAVTIEGIGENLPVEFLYRKNALAEIAVSLPAGTDFDLLDNYINNFVGDTASHRYNSKKSNFYLITDRTEFSIGVDLKGTDNSMRMLFFPAQHYSMDVLKKDKSLMTYQSDAVSLTFYEAKSPKYFEHDYTYTQGRRYTYSYFVWAIRFREINQEVGRVPLFYFYLNYAGTRDPSSVKYMGFNIGGTTYRFEVFHDGKVQKTDFGEYTQPLVIWMDRSNYPFFEKIAKGGKVTVTLQGDNFQLAFTMPNEFRTSLAKGLKLFEKVGGLSNAALTFGCFDGTPMTSN